MTQHLMFDVCKKGFECIQLNYQDYFEGTGTRECENMKYEIQCILKTAMWDFSNCPFQVSLIISISGLNNFPRFSKFTVLLSGGMSEEYVKRLTFHCGRIPRQRISKIAEMAMALDTLQPRNSEILSSVHPPFRRPRKSCLPKVQKFYCFDFSKLVLHSRTLVLYSKSDIALILLVMTIYRAKNNITYKMFQRRT